MDFRRINRDERRRRVLMDETEISPEAAADASSHVDAAVAEPARPYTEAALSPEQPRVLDLIPTRRWTNFVLLLLMLSGIAGMHALYGYVALGHTQLDLSQLPAINLGARGSMATWFSSVLLAASAVYGLLIYQIRRHRADDYRGRYRMWCWIVPLLLLGSLDQVAGIQQSARTALLHVAGIADYADAMLVWIGLLALTSSVVGGRLIIEMRACRLAVLMVLLSLAGLAGVASMQLGWLLPVESVFGTMVRAALTLGAHVALLMSILLYGRHVHLDAQGQLSVNRVSRRKKKKRQSRPPSGSKDGADGQRTSGSGATRSRRRSGKITRTDPPHESSGGTSKGRDASSEEPARDASNRSKRKIKRRVAAEACSEANSAANSATGPTAAPCEPDDDQVDQPPRKLSKAERKRLRKQRRRQQTS